MAISYIEKHIVDNEKTYIDGQGSASFNYPLSIYYKDLFRLYMRVGLEQKAKRVLNLLRLIQLKEKNENVYRIQNVTMLDGSNHKIILESR